MARRGERVTRKVVPIQSNHGLSEGRRVILADE